MNVGLIGAGSIARQAYLPVLRDFKELKLTAIVEPDLKIRSDAVRGLNVAYSGSDLDTALNHVDAVIVCTPNYLHYPIAKACLDQGKHVLCEKPVTTSVMDSEKLLRIVETRSLTFTIGHVRRFYPAVKKIKEIISRRTLGTLTSFDFREGTVFSWPTMSGYIFDREKAGGGVLMDIGVHLLDLLLFWMDGDPIQVDYADDAWGGLESFVDARLSFPNGITGRIRLSRLSVLRNTYDLVFENGRLQWSPFTPGNLCIQESNRKPQFISFKKENPTRVLLADFYTAVRENRKPQVTLTEAIRTLKLIEHCYQTRKPLSLD